MKYFLATTVLFSSLSVYAGKASVVDATATCKTGICNFSVTVQHDDDGWDHYANRYEVLDKEGKILGTRVLAHPHSPEPFTRSLYNITIPEGTDKVILRAHDSVHKYGGKEFTIELH